MQRCLHCQSQQLDGTIFCSDCGASMLPTSNRRETTASLGFATGATVVQEGVVAVASAASRMAATTCTCLIVVASGRRFVLDGGSSFLVGRADKSRGISPDIDLGPDGGFDAGVSRKHAQVLFRNGSYLLEDLESANGTFLNERPMVAGRPLPLAHGDVVRFGTLTLRVEIG
jgi:hypothetical protein